MSEQQHTPGPMTQGYTNEGEACVWLGGATEPKHEMGPDATWIDCNTKANARRIAACWNACEGFSIEELEGANLFKDSIESQDLIDELLAALLVAHKHITADRASCVWAAEFPDGSMDIKDAAILQEAYDSKLAQIEAAIAKATAHKEGGAA